MGLIEGSNSNLYFSWVIMYIRYNFEVDVLILKWKGVLCNTISYHPMPFDTNNSTLLKRLFDDSVWNGCISMKSL